MAHELDINDGQASFVSAREDAWHQLGTVLDDTFTAEQAMTAGLLGGWNVRKLPIYAKVEMGDDKFRTTKSIPVPDRSAIVRDNPVVAGQVDVLGDVGKDYTIVQNEEHAGLLNALVDEGGAHFETAGALKGGKQVFVTMKLPSHIRIGGVDPVDTYIAAINSHDGSMSFTMMVTPVRVVCANTLNMAFSGASHMFKVRHTRGASSILAAQARESLDMTFNFIDGFQEEAERLIQTTLTEQAFEKILTREFGAGKDAAKSTVTRTETKIDAMLSLFADAGTQAGIRNTAWAGLNAMTEWADHFSPVRGLEADRDATRAQKAVLEPAFKNKALQLMRSHAQLVAA